MRNPALEDLHLPGLVHPMADAFAHSLAKNDQSFALFDRLKVKGGHRVSVSPLTFRHRQPKDLFRVRLLANIRPVAAQTFSSRKLARIGEHHKLFAPLIAPPLSTNSGNRGLTSSANESSARTRRSLPRRAPHTTSRAKQLSEQRSSCRRGRGLATRDSC